MTLLGSRACLLILTKAQRLLEVSGRPVEAKSWSYLSNNVHQTSTLLCNSYFKLCIPSNEYLVKVRGKIGNLVIYQVR